MGRIEMVRPGLVPVRLVRASYERDGLLLDSYGPPPTLALGSELVVNGDMETGSPPSNWTAANGTALSVADERTGGSGSVAIALTSNTGVSRCSATQNPTTLTGAWYLLTAWARRISATGYAIRFLDQSSSALWASRSGTSTAWSKVVTTGRAGDTDAAVNLAVDQYLSGVEARFDDVSLVPITLSTLLTGGGDVGRKSGVRCRCQPTLPTTGQGGMAICAGPSGLYRLEAYYDRNDAKAHLVKVENGFGNFTELIAAAVTYVAAANLDVEISGPESAATVKLLYGGVQVGTNQTVDVRPYGTLLQGFATYDDVIPGRLQAWAL